MRRNAFADALADRKGAFAAGIGQDQREFVPAEPRDDVRFAGAAADDGGGLDERAAAAQMAVTVVNRLEPVEIDEKQRQGPAATGGALGFTPQDRVQVPRVVEARQVVGDR